MVVRSADQPCLDHSRFVSGVIVHDDVDVEAVRDLSVDLLEEIKKFRSVMTLVAFANHKAGSDVEGCEQRHGAMANIRMGPAFRNARHHRQDRLVCTENSIHLCELMESPIIGR